MTGSESEWNTGISTIGSVLQEPISSCKLLTAPAAARRCISRAVHFDSLRRWFSRLAVIRMISISFPTSSLWMRRKANEFDEKREKTVQGCWRSSASKYRNLRIHKMLIFHSASARDRTMRSLQTVEWQRGIRRAAERERAAANSGNLLASSRFGGSRNRSNWSPIAFRLWRNLKENPNDKRRKEAEREKVEIGGRCLSSILTCAATQFASLPLSPSHSILQRRSLIRGRLCRTKTKEPNRYEHAEMKQQKRVYVDCERHTRVQRVLYRNE